MKVADLQETLRQVCRLLASAGATKLTELTEFADALEKFKDQQLRAFTGLLGRLSEHGELAPKVKATKQPTQSTTSKADPAKMAVTAKKLYDDAATLTTADEVLRFSDQLATLTGPGLKTVAQAIELKVLSKWKNQDTLNAIRQRIVDRMGAAIRRQLLDRPPGGAVSNVTPTTAS